MMRSAWSYRYWRSAISIWCTRGFCAEWPTITWCWWRREALPGITASLPSSSLMGKVAHVTVCFCSSLLTSGLNLTHPLAEYFLACLWVYKHSLSACCSTPTVRGDCHLLSTEQPGECTTMASNLLLWRCSTRALQLFHTMSIIDSQGQS